MTNDELLPAQMPQGTPQEKIDEAIAAMRVAAGSPGQPYVPRGPEELREYGIGPLGTLREQAGLHVGDPIPEAPHQQQPPQSPIAL